jgi:hypothetical protein
VERKLRNFLDRKFWARGYFVSTVGRDEETIRAYIKNQEIVATEARVLLCPASCTRISHIITASGKSPALLWVIGYRTTQRAHKKLKQQTIGPSAKIVGAERAPLVMEITRQPDASRDQCDCHDEGQRVSKHSVRVFVFFAIALVFSEAQ